MLQVLILFYCTISDRIYLVSACTGNDSDDEILSMLLNIKNIATHISNKDLNT